METYYHLVHTLQIPHGYILQSYSYTSYPLWIHTTISHIHFISLMDTYYHLIHTSDPSWIHTTILFIYFISLMDTYYHLIHTSDPSWIHTTISNIHFISLMDTYYCTHFRSLMELKFPLTYLLNFDRSYCI
jgi:hypothetical protein